MRNKTRVIFKDTTKTLLDFVIAIIVLGWVRFVQDRKTKRRPVTWDWGKPWGLGRSRGGRHGGTPSRYSHDPQRTPTFLRWNQICSNSNKTKTRCIVYKAPLWFGGLLVYMFVLCCTIHLTLEFRKRLSLDVKVVPILCVDIGKDLPLLGVSLPPLQLLQFLPQLIGGDSWNTGQTVV